MNLFAKPPYRQDQRNRWLAILQVVENERLTNLKDMRTALARHGYTVSEPTLIEDLKACRVFKIDGAYTTVPYAVQDVVEDTLKYRMRAAVLGLFVQGDIVVLNTHRGAGGWLAQALKEWEEDHVMSTMAGPDAVWLMATEGRGDYVYQRLNELYMQARM